VTILLPNAIESYSEIDKIDRRSSVCIVPPFLSIPDESWFDRHITTPGIYRYCGKFRHEAFGVGWSEFEAGVETYRQAVKGSRRLASTYPVYNVVSTVMGVAALREGGQLIYADGNLSYLVESLNNLNIDTVLTAGFEAQVAQSVSKHENKSVTKTLTFMGSDYEKSNFAGSVQVEVPNLCTIWRQEGIWLGVNR